MNNNIKAKVIDNSGKRDSGMAKYTISYSSRKMENLQVSYKILSALKAKNDIIIEINSSYLNLSEKDNMTLLSKLIEAFEKLGIKYVKKKIKLTAKSSILSFIKEGKQYEGFELEAFIPDEIWHSQEFEQNRPTVGTRYYILNSDNEPELDTFLNLDVEERSDFCKMVIFDNISFESMGINTEALNKNDIIELLYNMN